MYSVALQSNSNFHIFLGITDAEYVDIFFDKDSALFVQNTNEIFSMIQLPAVCTVGENAYASRVKRDILKSVANSARAEFINKSDSIQIKSYNDDEKLKYTITLRNETVFASIYSEKMNYLAEHSSYTYFDARDLRDMQKIAKAAGSTINLDYNACGIIFRDGARVYRKYTCDSPISVSYRGFEALRKCNNFFFNVNNFVGAVNDSFAVLVNKVRYVNNEMFQSVIDDSFGSSFIANLNIANLRSFLAEKRIEADFVELDIDKKICTVRTNDAVYDIPMYFSDIKKSQNCSTHSIKLPVSLFKTVFNNLPSANYTLKVKQYFTQLEQGDYYILFK